MHNGLATVASIALMTACISASNAQAHAKLQPLSAKFTQFEALVPAAPSQGYSMYQGRDGRYESLSDFTRDLNGTPCGMACTARARGRSW